MSVKKTTTLRIRRHHQRFLDRHPDVNFSRQVRMAVNNEMDKGRDGEGYELVAKSATVNSDQVEWASRCDVNVSALVRRRLDDLMDMFEARSRGEE